MFSLRKQSGDTIVEVMMVLVILSSAISIAYATANRGLTNARQAQEASEMTENVQSQIESLRFLADQGTNDSTSTNPPYNAGYNIYYPSAPYCINTLSGANPVDTNLSHCNHPTPGFSYQLYIYNCDNMNKMSPTDAQHCVNTVPNSDTFVVVASWPDASGSNETDTVTQAYRVHPPTVLAAAPLPPPVLPPPVLPPPTSSCAQPHDIVLAFDASHSMTQPDASIDTTKYPTKEDAAKAAGKLFVNNPSSDIGTGNRVAVVAFAGFPVWNGKVYETESNFSINAPALNGAINKIKAIPTNSGGTWYINGIQAAMDFKPSVNPKAEEDLILLGDGANSMGRRPVPMLDAQTLVQARKAGKMGIKIYTVGINLSPADVANYTLWAKVTGGIFRNANSPTGTGSLEDIYNKLDADVKCN